MFSEPLFKLPKQSVTIFKLLELRGPMIQLDLADALNLSLRSLRYTLKRMVLRGVISKKPNLTDMRSLFYVIDEDIVIHGVDKFMHEEGLVEI